MSRHRGPMRIALAAVAALTALAVVLLAWDRGRGGEPDRLAADGPAIEARADLSPRSVLFGDTVKALVDVTLDRDRVDPDSVRVRADFAPWRRLANPELSRQDGKTTTSLRLTFVLRCVTNSCVSDDPAAVQKNISTQSFPRARVTYTTREGAASGRRSLQAQWPQLTVGARYSSNVAQGAGASAAPWQADLLSLPGVTYSVTPGLLFTLLLAAGTVLAIAGGAFVYFALPRRALPPLPKPAGPPKLVLTPLERALALLENPVRVDGAADQRRALELVAAALVEHGDMTLAQAARALAWSKPVPGVEETSGLALRARSSLGEELHANPQ